MSKNVFSFTGDQSRLRQLYFPFTWSYTEKSFEVFSKSFHAIADKKR